MSAAEFWRDRPVLVTGCAGLLGAWLTESLVAREARVVGLIRDRVGDSRLFLTGLWKRLTLVTGCVEEYDLMERVINEYEIQTVFHLAAQAIVPIANENPRSTFETNIRGTWNVFEACRRSRKVAQVIFSSSDKAYGPSDRLPYTEDMRLRGTFPYDVSKSCADLLASSYATTYQLPVCTMRCANFYGGGDLNFNRLVPGTIWSVLREQPPIVRSTGQFSRDYLYVEDGAEAFCLAAERLAEEPQLRGEAFNVSYEVRMKALDVVHRILTLMDRPSLTPVILGQAPGEIIHQALDSRKARERLGWKPRHTFEEGLGRTIQWYREFVERAEARRWIVGAQPVEVVDD